MFSRGLRLSLSILSGIVLSFETSKATSSCFRCGTRRGSITRRNGAARNVKDLKEIWRPREAATTASKVLGNTRKCPSPIGERRLKSLSRHRSRPLINRPIVLGKFCRSPDCFYIHGPVVRRFILFRRVSRDTARWGKTNETPRNSELIFHHETSALFEILFLPRGRAYDNEIVKVAEQFAQLEFVRVTRPRRFYLLPLIFRSLSASSHSLSKISLK